MLTSKQQQHQQRCHQPKEIALLKTFNIPPSFSAWCKHDEVGHEVGRVGYVSVIRLFSSSGAL